MSKYDTEKFDLAPDPDLVCCICQCVLDKPVECPCRHVFCQVCIERWLTNRSNCPTCRKATYKHQLKPVLPLVQNMLNRLLMICDFRQNGCLDKVMLEQFDTHVKNCVYEMKTCRFSKCGQNILRRYLETHELYLCEHRELACEGECGLMIPLSEKPSHNCVAALKAHIAEKNKMIDSLKVKLQELSSLSQILNEELEQLRQLNDRPINHFNSTSTSSIDEDISSDFLSDFDDTSSISGDTIDNNELFNNDVSEDANIDGGNNDGTDVVEQVERTVVTSLFELSSRLERVRNQMRNVLNSGLVQDNTNLNDDVRIPSSALEAIVGKSNNSSSACNGLASNDIALAIDDENINNSLIDNMDRNANSQPERDGDDDSLLQGCHTSQEKDDDNAGMSLRRGNGLTCIDKISNADVCDSGNNQGHLENNNTSLNCPSSYVLQYKGLNSPYFSPTFHHMSILPHNTGSTLSRRESHYNMVSVSVPHADTDSLSIPEYTTTVLNYDPVTTRSSTNPTFQYASSSRPHIFPEYSTTYPSNSPTSGYQLRNQTYSPTTPYYNLSNPEYRALGSYIPTNTTDTTSFSTYTPTSLGYKPTSPDSSPMRHIVITQPPFSPDLQYTDNFEKENTESGHLMWSVSPRSPSDLHSRFSDLSSSIPSITSAQNSPDRQPDLDSDSSHSISPVSSFCNSLGSNSVIFSSEGSRILSPLYSSSEDSTTALEGKCKILISPDSSPTSQHANKPSHSSSYSGRKSRLEFHNDSILSISSFDEKVNLLTHRELNVKSETKFTDGSDGGRPNLLRNFEHTDGEINGDSLSGCELEVDYIRGNTLSWLNNVNSQNICEQTSVDYRNHCDNVKQFDMTKKSVNYLESKDVETPASQLQSVKNGNKKLNVLKPYNNAQNLFIRKEVFKCERGGTSQNHSASVTVKHNNVIHRSGISMPIVISETSDSETTDLDTLQYTEKHLFHGNTNDLAKNHRLVSNMECSKSTEQFADRSNITGDINQSHDFSHSQVTDYSHSQVTDYSHSQVNDYSHSHVADDFSHSQMTDTSDSRLNSLPWSQRYKLRKRRNTNFDNNPHIGKQQMHSSQKSAALLPMHLSCSDTGLHFKNNKAKSNERSRNVQKNLSSKENGQSLNVKIDLSLINFSGNLGTETGSSAMPNATLVHSSTNFTPMLGNMNMFGDNDNNKTKYYTPNGVRPVNKNGTHYSPLFKHKTNTLAKHEEKHYNKACASAAKVTCNTSILANRESQNVCLDDSDSSDFTWEPGSDIESDITITDVEETDASYEVQVPKSTAALLEEYASDESDESWTVGMS